MQTIHRFAVAAIVFTAGLLTVPTIQAQGLSGRLSLPTQSTSQTYAPSMRPTYWRVWNGVVPLRSSRTMYDDLTVVLTGAGRSQLSTCSYSMIDGGIKPTTWVVRKNTPIKVSNQNAWTHELHASGLASFKAEKTKRGSSRRIAIKEKGSAPIADRIHAHVRGHIHAINDLVACAKITSTGQFSIDSVRPGQYMIRIFRGPDEIHKASVSIPGIGNVELAKISIRPASKKAAQ